MRIVAVAFVAFAALALATCGLVSRGYIYRYRITVEVDTPQGVRSGSSVWDVNVKEGSGIPDRSLRTRVRGEAVAVDLPGGTLFALLRDDDYGVDYPHYVVGRHLRAHPDPSVPMTADWKKNMAAIRSAKPAFDLFQDEYPQLVRFRDIASPSSVESVDPSNLAASFGPGIHLRRISVAVTEDDVTEGIRKRLPWLSHQKGAFTRVPQWTPRDQRPLSAQLHSTDLIRAPR